MIIEILITVIIVAFAIFILIRNIKRKASGKPDCDCCNGCAGGDNCPSKQLKRDKKGDA